MVSVVWKTGAAGPRQFPGTISDSRKAVNYIQPCLQCVYLASYGRFPHQKLAKGSNGILWTSRPATQNTSMPGIGGRATAAGTIEQWRQSINFFRKYD